MLTLGKLRAAFKTKVSGGMHESFRSTKTGNGKQSMENTFSKLEQLKTELQEMKPHSDCSLYRTKVESMHGNDSFSESLTSNLYRSPI